MAETEVISKICKQIDQLMVTMKQIYSTDWGKFIIDEENLRFLEQLKSKCINKRVATAQMAQALTEGESSLSRTRISTPKNCVQLIFNQRKLKIVELGSTTQLKCILNHGIEQLRNYFMDEFTFFCYVSKYNVRWPLDCEEVMKEEFKGDAFRKCLGTRMANIKLIEIYQNLKADIDDSVNVYIFLRQLIKNRDPFMEETNNKVWASAQVVEWCAEEPKLVFDDETDEKPTKKDDAKPKKKTIWPSKSDEKSDQQK